MLPQLQLCPASFYGCVVSKTPSSFSSCVLCSPGLQWFGGQWWLWLPILPSSPGKSLFPPYLRSYPELSNEGKI